MIGALSSGGPPLLAPQRRALCNPAAHLRRCTLQALHPQSQARCCLCTDACVQPAVVGCAGRGAVARRPKGWHSVAASAIQWAARTTRDLPFIPRPGILPALGLATRKASKSHRREYGASGAQQQLRRSAQWCPDVGHDPAATGRAATPPLLPASSSRRPLRRPAQQRRPVHQAAAVLTQEAKRQSNGCRCWWQQWRRRRWQRQ